MGYLEMQEASSGYLELQEASSVYPEVMVGIWRCWRQTRGRQFVSKGTEVDLVHCSMWKLQRHHMQELY